jgi:hypothetical protein
LTTEKLTTPQEDVPKPASKKLEAKPKSKPKAIKLGIGVEVNTEEGKGIITKKGGKGQWQVEITEGQEKGEEYPFDEGELEATKEAAQDVKGKTDTEGRLEALSPAKFESAVTRRQRRQARSDRAREVRKNLRENPKAWIDMTKEELVETSSMLLEESGMKKLPVYKGKQFNQWSKEDHIGWLEETGAFDHEPIKLEATPNYKFEAVTARRQVSQGGYAALPLQAINDSRLMFAIDTQKWPTPHESSEFGTVNNRLSKELEVIEGLLGPIAEAKMMPGKLVKGKRKLTRTIGAYELGVVIDKAVKDGTFKKLLDPKNSVKELADEFAAKLKEKGFRQVFIKQKRKKFLKELKELRSGPVFLELDENGKPVLSKNGKAGMSVDLLLATCQPTTPCKECYAAKAMIRMSNVRKSVRNTIHLMVDPIGFAERINKEARKVKKTTLPFIRLLGSGDLTHATTVKSFNHLAKIADRPIHIFSRHHRNLAKLKGTREAPFIKMGSIDADLVKYYGMKFLKENMEKRGIANVFLLTDKSEIPTIEKLYKANALNLVFASNVKLHNSLADHLKQSSCPCDAQERTYMASCRRCALGMLGCHMAFADKGIDSKGKVWQLMDDKAPVDLSPVTQFVEGDEITEAYGRAAADIIQKSIELVNLYKRDFIKGKRKDIPLKDIRFPDDVIRVDSVEKAEQYVENLKAAKKLALKGTFELPGGEIQPGVSAEKGDIQFEAPTGERSFKNYAGTKIGRYKNDVGKMVSGLGLFVHRDYTDILPQAELRKAEKTLAKTNPDFEYNVVVYNNKDGSFRFHNSPDFDTAPEPQSGEFVKVMTNNTATKRSTATIWHHKWQWVRDDYTGFDVQESYDRSTEWASVPYEAGKIGHVKNWDKFLADNDLPPNTPVGGLRVLKKPRGLPG